MNSIPGRFHYMGQANLYIIAILLMSFWPTTAQNTLKKEINAEVNALQINGDQIFTIDIKTADTNSIYMEAVIEGEYKDGLVLVAEVEGDNLNIDLVKSPLFKDANDKLSAHKVIAAKLSITLPKHKTINLVSDIANVMMHGQYKALQMKLARGSFDATATVESAVIDCIDGNIKVQTEFTSKVTEDKSQLIKVNERTVWKLNTKFGRILVRKQ